MPSLNELENAIPSADRVDSTAMSTMRVVAALMLASAARARHGDQDANVGQKAGGTWAALPVLPAARTTPATTSIGSTMFVVGGSASDSLFSYEISTSTWATLPSCPYQRADGGAAASATEIYVAGGCVVSLPSSFFFFFFALLAHNEIMDAARVWTGARRSRCPPPTHNEPHPHPPLLPLPGRRFRPPPPLPPLFPVTGRVSPT